MIYFFTRLEVLKFVIKKITSMCVGLHLGFRAPWSTTGSRWCRFTCPDSWPVSIHRPCSNNSNIQFNACHLCSKVMQLAIQNHSNNTNINWLITKQIFSIITKNISHLTFHISPRLWLCSNQSFLSSNLSTFLIHNYQYVRRKTKILLIFLSNSITFKKK